MNLVKYTLNKNSLKNCTTSIELNIYIKKVIFSLRRIKKYDK